MKSIRCIECPKGCNLKVDINDGRVTEVTGNQCPKGVVYAKAEIENPVRVLTTTVTARNLSVRRVPVRTDAAIDKTLIFDSMKIASTVIVDQPLNVGDIVCRNLLKTGVNLIATRAVS